LTASEDGYNAIAGGTKKKGKVKRNSESPFKDVEKRDSLIEKVEEEYVRIIGQLSDLDEKDLDEEDWELYDVEEDPYEQPIRRIKQPTEAEAKGMAATLVFDAESIEADQGEYAFHVVEKLAWVLTNPAGNRKNDMEWAAKYRYTIKMIVRKLQEQLEEEKAKKKYSTMKPTCRGNVDTQTEREELGLPMEADNDTNKAQEGTQELQEFLPALKELIQRVKRLEEKLSPAGESDDGKRLVVNRSTGTKGDPVGKLDRGKRPGSDSAN